ncbi:hypothetical protein G3576_14870 [Roseomonas stagni]|uniref:Uncharacterized protein n=1 Tax=Falsiroseomonas algicola TaxID=2716930 RepID=A0A6M1LNE2_9PROT|nr:hypothetical protein [Falsiroseomonas algicola]NGM21304.1 hypothetical protein [Falsiroseomonas algicola]
MAHLTHGPFLVAEDGSLTPHRQPAMRFEWRGRDCEATFDDGQVSLTVQAGAIPYTAERAEVRPGAFAALGELAPELPEGWRLKLLPDHRVRLEAALPRQGDVTATALVRAMVAFALALDPYLDRLESAGLDAGRAAGLGAGGGGGGGRVKT